jgi:uncharacterized membrane protein
VSQNKPQIPNQNKYTASPQTSNQQFSLQVQQFSGLLPSPEVLEQYAKIYPGLEKTIVEMARQQTAHRIEIEKTVIASREKQSQIGQIFAFIIVILLVTLSAVAMFLHYPKVAVIIVATTITSTAALFLASKYIQRPQQKPSNKNKQSN